MRKFTIEIEVETKQDAENVLNLVKDAILSGSTMAPWDSDEKGNGYGFVSEGDFEAPVDFYDDDDTIGTVARRIIAASSIPVIPDEGFADGGEAYTAEELELINKDTDCPQCGGVCTQRCPSGGTGGQDAKVFGDRERA